MSSFYLTLPSNASTQSFPNNSPTRFCVLLARPFIVGKDKWEVAMSDLHYPNTWNNVIDAFVTVKRDNLPDLKISMPDGKYLSLSDVLYRLNLEISNGGIENVSFSHRQITNKIVIYINRDDLTLTFNSNLCYLLGGVDLSKIYSIGLTKLKGFPDLETGFEALYVYSSTVVPRIVLELFRFDPNRFRWVMRNLQALNMSKLRVENSRRSI